MKGTNSEARFEDTEIAFAAKSGSQLRRAFWLFTMIGYPWLVSIGTRLVKSALALRLPIKGLIKMTLFDHFCGGESQQDCKPTIHELGSYRIGTILDYSVEGADTEDSFDQTAEETKATILQAASSDHMPFCVFKVTGLASTSLMKKVSARQSLNSEEEGAWNRAKERVMSICSLGAEKGVRIFIDAEETWIQPVIDQLAMDMMELHNRQEAIVYNTYQLYLKDKLSELKQASKESLQKGFWLGAKLVRGAYMEKERDRAEEVGYNSPVQPNKQATDTDYNLGLDYCLGNLENTAICAGSHNEYSSYYLTRLMKENGIEPSDPRIYFAQLYGMSDHLSFNLAKDGYNVAKYVPYGPVEKVMPYLFRRAEENTSVKGQTSRELTLIKKELNRRKRK